MQTKQERQAYEGVIGKIALAREHIDQGWPDGTILGKLQEALNVLMGYKGPDRIKLELAYSDVWERADSLVKDLGHLQDGRKILEQGLGSLRLEPAGART